jgi:predicted ATPase
VKIAAIDLRAGRKAKASAAYASACAYFAAGMALLDENDWNSQYELTFSLWLECAECGFLIGGFDRAEQLLTELLRRGATKIDEAAVYASLATSRRSTQNSGSSGSLLLSRKALSSSTPCRFIPAHRQLDPRADDN